MGILMVSGDMSDWIIDHLRQISQPQKLTA